MKRFVWYCFWALQVLGLICLSGGESFASTPIGFTARIFAVIVLEPGFIVMQAFIERVFFNTATLSSSQQFWIGSVSAIAFNALFLLLLIFFIGNIRPHAKELRK
jgi:hypothetical protein